MKTEKNHLVALLHELDKLKEQEESCKEFLVSNSIEHTLKHWRDVDLWLITEVIRPAITKAIINNELENY